MPYSKRAAIAALLVAVGLFAFIGANIAPGTPLALLDQRIVGWMQGKATPTVTQFMLFVTHAHSTVAISAYALVLALVFLYRRQRYWVYALLLAVGGLLRPSSGRILFRDRPIQDLPDAALAAFRREHVGFVMQNFSLIPYLTAVRNVMVPLGLQGVPVVEQEERASAALEEVGLGGRRVRQRADPIRRRCDSAGPMPSGRREASGSGWQDRSEKAS